MDKGSGANNAIGSLLGVSGDPGAFQGAFDNYKNSTGFQTRLKTGSDAITGSAAARGLLNSGSTLKRLTQYGQELGSGEFSNYLGQLGTLSNQGLAAGQTIGSAGSQAGASGAGAISQGYGNAANSNAAGFNDALGNFGYAFDNALKKWG